MGLTESLYKVSRLYPDKIGVICGDDRFTYREFATRVYQLAEALSSQGIARGDRLAIIHQNCHYFLEAYYAAAVLGVILCPLNYRLSARELVFILEDTGAKAIIAQPQFSQLVQESLDRGEDSIDVFWTSKGAIPKDGISIEALMKSLKGNVDDVEAGGDDIAQLYYTSGTTGRQKGVMLTHKNVAYHALGTIAELKMTDEDIWIHVAPMFHLADAWATWATTWVGAAHVMIPEFEPKTVMALMENESVTLTNMIPTMLNLMVNDNDMIKYDFSSLRMILSGGAPIAPEVVRKIMDAFGCDYVQTYGMTETSPYLTMSILKGYLKDYPEDEQFRFKAATGRNVIFKEGSYGIALHILYSGEGGLFIHTTKNLPVGSVLDLEFSLPDSNQAITTKGKVVWTRPQDVSTEKMPPGMGIQFIDMNPNDNELLNNYLAKFGSS